MGFLEGEISVFRKLLENPIEEMEKIDLKTRKADKRTVVQKLEKIFNVVRMQKHTACGSSMVRPFQTGGENLTSLPLPFSLKGFFAGLPAEATTKGTQDSLC